MGCLAEAAIVGGSTSSSLGLIIGIVVGVFVVVLILAFYLAKRFKKRRTSGSKTNQPTVENFSAVEYNNPVYAKVLTKGSRQGSMESDYADPEYDYVLESTSGVGNRSYGETSSIPNSDVTYDNAFSVLYASKTSRDTPGYFDLPATNSEYASNGRNLSVSNPSYTNAAPGVGPYSAASVTTTSTVGVSNPAYRLSATKKTLSARGTSPGYDEVKFNAEPAYDAFQFKPSDKPAYNEASIGYLDTSQVDSNYAPLVKFAGVSNPRYDGTNCSTIIYLINYYLLS